MEDLVKCPFCGDEKGDLWDLFSSSDDEEISVECDSCEKSYAIRKTVSITYSTYPDPDFEEYLDRHPEIRKNLENHTARMEAIIGGSKNESQDA
jgi:transcription elongation factor Elf1